MAQMRGLFPLPSSSPQNNGIPNALALPSGGVWYPPSGTYLITTGSQTIVEWYDPVGTIWRQYSGPETLAQISCDGTNYRLVNNSGTCVGGNITNQGSGGTNGIGPVQTGSTVTFAAPAAGGVTAQAQGYVVVGGSVPAPTITQGGSGFLVPPIVCCDPPPPGGVQAIFTTTISAAGVITAVTPLQNTGTGTTSTSSGAGYTSVPQFYIIPQWQFFPGALRFPGDVAGPTNPQNAYPPGLINPANAWNGSPYQGNLVTGTTGALLTGAALTGSNSLTAIVMTAFGGGYTGNSQATISFGGTSLGAVAATPIMSFCITGATAAATGGAGQAVGTNVVTSLGLVAGFNNNNTFFPRPARGVLTNANGTFTVEDPGYGLQGAVVVETGGTALATVTNTQYGGRVDTSIIQAMVQ
jgi:hypothetical protein